LYNFRTDLALERNEIVKKKDNLKNIEGIETEENKIDENLTVSTVRIINDNGAKVIGKPIGNYITIDLNKFNIAQEEEIEKYANCLADEIKKLVDVHIEKQDDVLIVGLGNEYVTPDALGPKVAKEIEVTRHLLKYMPEYVKPGTRPISAIAPGVLGVTGIETLEIVQGVVDKTTPKMLIVIDSLASRKIERISSTIQIADTGIVPGAGVGNTRKELSKETLGIPVIAIRYSYSGRPTVLLLMKD